MYPETRSRREEIMGNRPLQWTRAAVFALAGANVVQPTSPCFAAAIGGQDVEITHILDADGSASDLHLAIASDGTAFAVLEYRIATPTEWQIRVYRSSNGGKTWAAWGDPLEHTPYGSIDATIAPGDPEQLLIAYGWAASPSSNGIGLERADVDDAAPTWQWDAVAYVLPPVFASSPHVSAIEGPSGAARVGVIWKQDELPETAVEYAHSTDGGASFTPSVTLATAPLGGYFNTDVALDAGGVVQAAWTFVDDVTETGQCTYRRATDGGESLSDWSSPVLLENVDFDAFVYPSVATSPTSGGVIVAVQENADQSDVHLYVSTDAGLTWPHPVKVFDGKRHSEAAWGEGGPALSTSNEPGGDRFEIIRPLGAVTGPWAAHGMLFPDDFLDSRASLAADPSHDGAFATVALMPNLEDAGGSPWFDAEWRADPGFGVPEFEPGFDIGTGKITSAPLIADLDNDGDREVVYTASNPHRVARFDLDTMTATTLKSTAATSAASAPAMLVLDTDGTSGVFVGVDTGRVIGAHEDGTSVPGYPVDTGSGAPTWVSGGRVTGSEYAEVVAATARSIFLYGPTGDLSAGFPFTAAPQRGNVVGRAAIGDLDDDGEIELVAVYEHGVLVLSAGGILEESLLLSGPAVSAGVSLADLDADGDLEIAVPRANGSVALVHHDGASYGAAWPWASGTGQPIGSIAIADFFGGSEPDLIFSASTGETFAVDLTGAQPSGWSFAVGAHVEDAPEPIVSKLADVGRQIVLGDLDDTGYVRRPLGPQAGWPRSFHGEVEHAAAASDLDGDGNVELVIPAGHRLWILDMGVPDGPANTNWPMAGARSARTGCRDCDVYWPTGIDDAATAAPTRAALHAGAPNPFRESTIVRYDVPASARSVRVDVYDVAGRLVRALVDGPQPGGAHSVSWDGRDRNGRVVASGVYLVRLSVDGEKRTTRVVRLN
jgi:hypothetical protein